jgi:hypothetical protein
VLNNFLKTTQPAPPGFDRIFFTEIINYLYRRIPINKPKSIIVLTINVKHNNPHCQYVLPTPEENQVGGKFFIFNAENAIWSETSGDPIETG